MSNTKNLFAFSLLIVSSIVAENKPIMLEAKLLHLIDGSFINADRIEETRQFQVHLLGLLLGERQPDGTRIGRYIFQGKPHSVEMLQEQELLIKKSKELSDLLEQAKNDFIEISNKFRKSARGLKSFTVKLIEESCQKRNRTDSILLTWAQTTIEKEQSVFKKEVTSFEKLETFIADLFNFLTDLNNSCPKAQAHYHNRVTKYKAIKELLPKEIEKIEKSIDKIAFLTHVKRQHLDSLTLENITPNTVYKLLVAFTQRKSPPHNE
ncbi:MAG: hypothetical protein NT124_03805 [Candidatus Dependentiae bacterium]|nr:hypothetical protein [Candidatus Dependentiae bacterium]